MELIIEPDTYTPSIDDIGNYIDKIPSFNTIKYGIRCNCGSRKDKKYETYNNFYAHIKTKIHQKWLSELNTNKANYYIENENLKHTLHNQKMIIAKLDKELNSKNMTIGYLTQQLTNNNNNNNKIVNDLIFFD
jgi:hypothetical protein